MPANPIKDGHARFMTANYFRICTKCGQLFQIRRASHILRRPTLKVEANITLMRTTRQRWQRTPSVRQPARANSCMEQSMWACSSGDEATHWEVDKSCQRFRWWLVQINIPCSMPWKWMCPAEAWWPTHEPILLAKTGFLVISLPRGDFGGLSRVMQHIVT